MNTKSYIAGILALVVVVSFCGLAVLVALYPLPTINGHYTDLVFGALIAQFAHVLGYYFGSSRNAETRPVLKPTVPESLEKKP